MTKRVTATDRDGNEIWADVEVYPDGRRRMVCDNGVVVEEAVPLPTDAAWWARARKGLTRRGYEYLRRAAK